jgi:hypothetical protein
MEQHADRELTTEALMSLRGKISMAISSEKYGMPLLRVDKDKNRRKI